MAATSRLRPRFREWWPLPLGPRCGGWHTRCRTPGKGSHRYRPRKRARRQRHHPVFLVLVHRLASGDYVTSLTHVDHGLHTRIFARSVGTGCTVVLAHLSAPSPRQVEASGPSPSPAFGNACHTTSQTIARAAATDSASTAGGNIAQPAQDGSYQHCGGADLPLAPGLVCTAAPADAVWSSLIWARK
jgi:hypothetical protein